MATFADIPDPLPRWLRGPQLMLLFCPLMLLAYSAGFFHLGTGVAVAFLVAWWLPMRHWPWLALGQLLVILLTGIVITRVTGDVGNDFLGSWPGPVQFVLGNFVTPVAVLLGPWWLRRRGVHLHEAATLRHLLQLFAAIALVAVVLVAKDVLYVISEGRVGTVRQFVRGDFVELQGLAGWQAVGELAVTHFLGAFIGPLVLVPLAWWWASRRLYAGNARILFVGLCWLLPVLLGYVTLALINVDTRLGDLLRLLLLVTVVVFSMRWGWRGAALALVGAVAAIAIEDHLGMSVIYPVWMLIFIGIVGALALANGAARDGLAARHHALAVLQEQAEALARELRGAAMRNARAEEQERKWLAMELHDEFGQSLTALQAQLVRASSLAVAAGDLRLADDLQQNVTRMRRGLSEVLDRLRPAVLDAVGLYGAIERGAVRRMVEQAGLQYTVELQGDARLFGPLEDALCVTAYRVVQGAASNVVRHAHASRCHVRVRINERNGWLWLFIRVSDDGIGRTDRVRPGHGLTGLTDRLTMHGGILRLRDRKPGLRVHCLLRQPLMGRRIWLDSEDAQESALARDA